MRAVNEKVRKREANSQPSVYKSATLTPLPRTTTGTTALLLLTRHKEEFSFDFVCIF
jgi:hypothetical protein